MRLRGLLIGGIAAVLIVAGVLAGRSAPARASGPTAHIAVLAPGSWCWFGDPRALALPGTHQTIVGWISPTGAVTVASYDSHLGVILTRVVGHREDLAAERVRLRGVRLHREGGRVDRVKLRYRAAPLPARVDDALTAGHHREVTVDLPDGVEGPAPGQLACLLDGDLVVGWGTIARAV